LKSEFADFSGIGGMPTDALRGATKSITETTTNFRPKGAPDMADVNPNPMANEARRPLSPHLQVYRMTLTMFLSGLHRVTGMALYLGTLLLAWWLIAAASDAKSFETVSWLLSSIIGRLVLFGFTCALFTHMMGGIRHFIWDSGRGMEHPQREYLAQMTIWGGLILSVVVWIIAYAIR
jgi:succinate dehydrogenase / fumarate reductase cytochrome b subunit